LDFNSHTDGVIKVAVGLVNSLTPGERRGRPAPPPADAAAAATEGLRVGYPEHRPATEAEAAELVEVALRLRAVFAAVAAGDLDTAALRINALLVETDARPMLQRHDGEPWHLHFHGPGGAMAGDWAASCATGLALVLGSEFADRLGSVHGAALRSGVRGRLAERDPPVLLHAVPEPGQDRGVPRPKQITISR
jgi:hypothetical protein